MIKSANFGIKFDLKKFYHEIDLHPTEYQYYGFTFPYGDKMTKICILFGPPYHMVILGPHLLRKA